MANRRKLSTSSAADRIVTMIHYCQRELCIQTEEHALPFSSQGTVLTGGSSRSVPVNCGYIQPATRLASSPFASSQPSTEGVMNLYAFIVIAYYAGDDLLIAVCSDAIQLAGKTATAASHRCSPVAR